MINHKSIIGSRAAFFSSRILPALFIIISNSIQASATKSTTLQVVVNEIRTDSISQGSNKKIAITRTGDKQSDRSREYILSPGENVAKKIRNNLFLKAQAEKNSCYVGEPILVTYKLYSRLTTTSKITRQPALGGFSVYDMIDFISNTESTEIIQNRLFKVHVLRKAQLIPLQIGTMELDPIEVHNTVHFLKSSSPSTLNSNSLQDLVDQFTAEESLPSADIAVKIESSPVRIVVKSFPEANRPRNFNGAVGSFTIKAYIVAKNLAANDAGVLNVEIKGFGNLSLIGAPTVAWPQDIDELNIVASEKINKNETPLGGTKNFEYIFTPLKAGTYKIPPISFSYFNPSSHSYQIIQTQQNAFQVSDSKKLTTGRAIDNAAHSQKKNNSILRALKFLKSQMVWFVIVSTLLILVFYLLQRNKNLRRKKEYRVPVVTPSEDKNEEKNLAHPADILEDVRTLLAKEDYQRFYPELNSVLWNKISTILKLAPTQLNKQNISQALQNKGWTSEMTNRLDTILIKCERSVYLPDYQQETDAANVLEMAEKVVEDLDRFRQMTC